MIKKLGTIVYCVYKKYVDDKLNNGKVVIGRIASYQNVNGEILPEIKLIGKNGYISLSTHYCYDTLLEAVGAIDVGSTLDVPRLLKIAERESDNKFEDAVDKDVKYKVALSKSLIVDKSIKNNFVAAVGSKKQTRKYDKKKK